MATNMVEIVAKINLQRYRERNEIERSQNEVSDNTLMPIFQMTEENKTSINYNLKKFSYKVKHRSDTVLASSYCLHEPTITNKKGHTKLKK